MTTDPLPEDVMTYGALNAIAYERAPRYPNGKVNHRVICRDGFTVSIQASSWHYAKDSSGRRPYFDDTPAAYPYVSFEVGAPNDEIEPIGEWEKCESGGVWAFVPRWAVEELLVRHGGVVAFERPEQRGGER